VYDLRSFSLEDMYRCSAELRRAGILARGADDAARRIVGHFYERLVTSDTHERECALVRLFRMGHSPGDEAQPRTVILSLRATRGFDPDWNDPARSRNHRRIAVGADSPAADSPMIAALLARLGIPAGLFSTERRLLEDPLPLFEVFHVEHALGSPFVPAQEDFVRPHGIQSVLGIGGLLPPSHVFIVLLFSRVLISRRVADLFRMVAPSAGLALIRSEGDPSNIEAALGAYERIVGHHERIALAQHEELRTSAEALARTLDERQQAEQEKKVLLERAEEARAEALAANRAKDDFLGAIGHELRNPLSPILSAVQLLTLRGARSGELEAIERQAAHLGRLVDDLVDVSRIARGELEVSMRPTETARVVSRAVETSWPHFVQRRQRLEVDVPPSGLPVTADLERLAQAVANLLINASKYSPEASCATVSARRAGSVVRVRVRDEGAGIASDMLGLSIARSLTELHGGSLRFSSTYMGAGSEFILDLPLLHGEALEGQSADPASPTRRSSDDRRRILLVDDNDDAANTLADGLAEVGFDVLVASDGPSAVRVASSFKPQVALLDIELPSMDGYALARRVRALPGMPEGLLLIAVTGYGQEADRRRSLQAGFALHLVKPVGLDALTTAIRSAS
jgi:signal transduction histidine kinase